MSRGHQDQSPGSVQLLDFEVEANFLLNRFLASSSNARNNEIQARTTADSSRRSQSPNGRRSVHSTTNQPNMKIKRSPILLPDVPSRPATSPQFQVAATSESNLRQKQDALRAKLLEIGLWFEDVDELIKSCEADACESRKSHRNPNMILSSSEMPALTLEKASDLCPGIGIVAGWSKPKKTHSNRVCTERQSYLQTRRKSKSNNSQQSTTKSADEPNRGSKVLSSNSRSIDPGNKPLRLPQSDRRNSKTLVNQHPQNPQVDLECSRSRTPLESGLLDPQDSVSELAKQNEIPSRIKPLPRFSSRSSKPTGPAQQFHSRLGSRRQTESPYQPTRTVTPRSSSRVPTIQQFAQDRVSQSHDLTRKGRFRSVDSKEGSFLALRCGEKACWQLKTKCVRRRITDSVESSFRKWKSWIGASHDVINVGWSPDGTRFVAGSAALEDLHTMQYNRPNNLLIGNLVTNSMISLPDHRRRRPLPETVSLGPNSLTGLYSTSDEWLYTTITALGWSSVSAYLFTGSYDKTVKVWDTSINATEIKCMSTLQHEAKVEAMAVSKHPRSLLASSTNQGERSLRLYNFNEDYSDGSYSSLVLKDDVDCSSFPYAPGPLQFGISNASMNYLAAGFGSDEKQNFAPSSQGYLALYRIAEGIVVKTKVQPYKQNVFDIAWSPHSTHFATGNAAPLLERKKGKINSQVRIYDVQELPGRLIEYDCPALDINEVTFCDYDANYVTASCTDGSTYVWDFRRPDQILHRLPHGGPLSELLHDRPREVSDVGVRASQWGNHTHEFYTGASDGILKLWDIRRSPEDVFVRDAAIFNAEIMSAKLSPDKSNMIIGDGQGSIHLLSTAPLGGAEDVEDIVLRDESGTAKTSDRSYGSKAIDAWTEGRTAAQELLSTNQIVLDPRYGAGKGPNYCGPYARWARPQVTGERNISETRLLPKFQALQLDQTRWTAKRPKRSPMILPQGAVVIELEDSDDNEASGIDRELIKKRRVGRDCIAVATVIDLTDEEHENSYEQESEVISFSDPEDAAWEHLEEDHWFPPSASYSANISEDST